MQKHTHRVRNVLIVVGAFLAMVAVMSLTLLAPSHARVSEVVSLEISEVDIFHNERLPTLATYYVLHPSVFGGVLLANVSGSLAVSDRNLVNASSTVAVLEGDGARLWVVAADPERYLVLENLLAINPHVTNYRWINVMKSLPNGSMVSLHGIPVFELDLTKAPRPVTLDIPEIPNKGEGQ